MQLIFDYPWYFLLLCLLAGGLCSFALYWRRPVGSKGVTLLLSALRFAAVSLIAFLLLAPLVKRHTSEQERPIVVVARDVSESVNGMDAGEIDLGDGYEVAEVPFGGSSTDIAAALHDIGDRYAGRNLGAVVLVSDGICNQGLDPAATAPELGVPIYTVALGDTARRPDAFISDIRCNRFAYLGEQTPIEVTLRAHRLRGLQGTLSVSSDRLIHKSAVRYDDNDFTHSETIAIDADKPGLRSFTVTLSTTLPDGTAAVSRRTIAIEVIDGRRKVGILAAAPHPDISALRQAIERNPNYETVLLTGAPGEKLADFDLLVLHNLPATADTRRYPIDRVPAIFILGSQTDLPKFNALHSGLEIVAKNRKTDEVTALRNNSFALFSLDDGCCRRIEQLPPLSAPFGNCRTAANLQTLFSAKLGNIDSGRPLIACCQQDGVRRTFIVGEGLWRWRLQDFLMTGSHDDFDLLVEKLMAYTSLRTDKERFRVNAQHIYRDDEDIVIRAELYDDNCEPVNTPEASLAIDGRQYPFGRTAGGYVLNLGALAPGQYSYTAAATLAGKKHSASGSFIVEELRLEQANLTADHTLLSTIAQTTGAQMLLPAQTARLKELLDARDDIKTLLYSHTRYTDLLNLPLLFILLVLLLAAEWAVRKYNN